MDVDVGEAAGHQASPHVDRSGAGPQLEAAPASEYNSVPDEDVLAVTLEKQVVVHYAEFLQS